MPESPSTLDHLFGHLRRPISERMISLVKQSEPLEMLKDSSFIPDQSPHAKRVTGDGRLIFSQKPEEFAHAQFVRIPLCLLPEGDTDLLRAKHVQLNDLNRLLTTLPTATMLFDAVNVKGIIPPFAFVWFSEEELFANTAARALGIDAEKRALFDLQNKFTKEAEDAEVLLSRFINQIHKKKPDFIRMPFHNEQVQEAIKGSMSDMFDRLGDLKRKGTDVVKPLNVKRRNKILNTNAALIASTHTLFPLIFDTLAGGQNHFRTAVQGPVHLETHPPRWKGNSDLDTVVTFFDNSAEYLHIPHRSWIPCLVSGNPIGEIAAFTDNSPQLRRDQRRKLEAWKVLPALPLSKNPVFGHAIGLLELPEVKGHISDMLDARAMGDQKIAQDHHHELTSIILETLDNIDFWI